MTIVTNNYQIGQSAVPSQNFHMTTPAVPDGTLSLFRGNVGSPIGGAVVTIAADGSVTWPTDTAWTSQSIASIASGTGTITNGNGTIRWKRVGKTVFIQALINVVTNGTGASSVIIGGFLPFVPFSTTILVGREVALSGNIVSATCNAGSTIANLQRYDNAYPAASGAAMLFNGVYETT